jgi:nicotinamide-nucleotide amidase
VVDTNAAYISETITAAGARVVWRTTVGDNVDLIIEAMARAMQRCELVVTTGGLGPTNDDLTKKAICKYFKRPLVFHDEILEKIEERFKARGIAMPAINQNQALQPQGAEFIENEIGSAVGIAIEEGGHLFVSLPGIPDEMKMMTSGWIADRVRTLAGSLLTIHRKIKVVGLFESALFEKIADLVENRGGTQPEDKISIAFLPSLRGIEIRLTVTTRNESDGRNQIAQLEKKIADRVGAYIFGYDDDTLPAAVGRLLRQSGATLSVAESCTGGLLGKLITDTPGSSEFFVGGVIAYSNELKNRLLGVPREIISSYGAVSEQCAQAMAYGVRRVTGATIGLSITGIAGPDGGTPEKPVGLIYIGLSNAEKTIVAENRYGAGRARNRERSVTEALNMIRKNLLGID